MLLGPWVETTFFLRISDWSMLILLLRNQLHLGMSFLWSSFLRVVFFFLSFFFFRWSEESSKNIPYFHSPHSGVSKGCGRGQIWNTHTPFSSLQAVAFLSSQQEEATSVFLVLCHFYLWKEIWSLQWLLQSWLKRMSLPPPDHWVRL